MNKIMIVALAFTISLPAMGSTAAECLKKVDLARTSLLGFKENKGSEATVHETAKDVTDCLAAVDAKGKTAKKEEAIAAWKTFRSIREDKLVPAIKAGNKAEADKLASDNKANLDKTKNALNAITGGD